MSDKRQTRHTTQHVHNPSALCPCIIEHPGGIVERIGYCPKHKAAPAMYEALRTVATLPGFEPSEPYGKEVCAALAQADEESD